MESRDWSSDVCSSDLFPSHDSYSPFENIAVEKKWISTRGFVAPEFRSFTVPRTFSFSQDPLPFLNELFAIRAIKNLIITDTGKLIHKSKFLLNTDPTKKILTVNRDKLLELNDFRKVDPYEDGRKYFDELCRQLPPSDISYLLKLKSNPPALIELLRQLFRLSDILAPLS